MKVISSYPFAAEPHAVWPLLFGSKMTLPSYSPLFFLGLPKPVECRLASSETGVGATRECVSDRGRITQTITEWNPGKRLTFHMIDTDLYFQPCVASIEDDFELQLLDSGQTTVTRTTTFEVRGLFKSLKAHLLAIGLRRIHRFVFKNWAHALGC